MHPHQLVHDSKTEFHQFSENIEEQDGFTSLYLSGAGLGTSHEIISNNLMV